MKNIYRICLYLFGILLLALGGILTIKSNLGASPISSLPLSLSTVTTISLGTASIVIFTLYVVLQILILRKEFKPIQLTQIIFAILFGKVMNIFNIMIHINVDNFYIRLCICFLSFFITALGIICTLSANLVPVAPDGLAQAISKKFKLQFGKAKIGFDFGVVILSVAILLLNNKGILGLGIGTILSAFFVGKIAGMLKGTIGDKIANLVN